MTGSGHRRKPGPLADQLAAAGASPDNPRTYFVAIAPCASIGSRTAFQASRTAVTTQPVTGWKLSSRITTGVAARVARPAAAKLALR